MVLGHRLRFHTNERPKCMQFKGAYGLRRPLIPTERIRFVCARHERILAQSGVARGRACVRTSTKYIAQ